MRRALCRLLLLLPLLGSLHPSAAQSASAADTALEEARAVYLEQGPAPALALFERALALYREDADRHGEAITLGLIGNCRKHLGDLDEARRLLEQALAMKRALGDRLEEGKTLSHLGLLDWERADYPSAIGFFRAAIDLGAALPDARLEGSARNNLGLVFDELGEYDRSVAEYQRALTLYRGLDFSRGESDTLGNLGGVELLLGRFREASGYYEQALALSRRIGSKPSMSQDLGNLALCATGLGDFQSAMARFDAALALAREAGLAKEEADWLKGKGALLVESGRHAEGLEHFAQALARYEASGLERERVETLLELAQVHLELGDPAAAGSQLEQARALAHAIGHERGELAARLALGELEWRRQRFEQARALFVEVLRGALAAGDLGLAIESRIDLARTDRAAGDLERAGEAARKALTMARATGARLRIAEALFAVAEVDRLAGRGETALVRYREGDAHAAPFGEPDVAWRLAYGRGRTLEALGRDREAADAYRAAVGHIEAVRSRLRDERFRAGYIEERHQPYVDLVRVLIRLGDDEGAFAAAERLRARSYLDLLARRPARAPTDDEERRERELRRRIDTLQRALEAEGSAPDGERGPAVTLLSRELAAAESRYEDLLAGLRTADPALASSWSATVPTAATVRAHLPADSALVEYVVGENALMVFLLTREHLATRLVTVKRGDLEAKVELVRDLVVRRSGDAWRAPAASLGRLLLGELTGWRQHRRLLLVPHGVLHHLPFALLPIDTSGTLLIEEHDLVELPAAGRVAYAPKRQAAPGRLLVAAPGVARLPHAREEARLVALASPPPREVLIGAAASESAFKRQAGDFRLVHLATHSAWNRLNPMLTSLELEPGAGEDGHLELHEVLDLPLRADVVTLSGCETALGGGFSGDVPVGDDFVGLTRAFLHAGSRAVLASLWRVDDRSTLALMRDVYDELPASGPAAALAAAQRRCLDQPARSHPYHWAAFVVVRGDEAESR